VRVHAIVEDLATARRAVEAGATVVQLRLKAPTPQVVAAGRGFGDLGATFVVNDDVEAALALGADGVHLGQADRGAGLARGLGLMLGRSAARFLDIQRAAHLQRMHELTELKRSDNMADVLLADHGLYHLEADLRWIDHTAARLDLLTRSVRR